jgi:hypothetical protein
LRCRALPLKISDVDSQIAAALIGLGGVVVGAMIGGFVANLRPNVRTVRGIARLLQSELAPFVQTADAPVPDALWAAHREMLAAELRLSDWRTVLAGYTAAFELNAAQLSGSPLSYRASSTASGKVNLALEVLAGLSGDWPWVTQTLRRLRLRRVRRPI